MKTVRFQFCFHLFAFISVGSPLNPDDPNVCSHWERSVSAVHGLVRQLGGQQHYSLTHSPNLSVVPVSCWCFVVPEGHGVLWVSVMTMQYEGISTVSWTVQLLIP